MRFASTNPSSKVQNPLSLEGIDIVSSAPELCYLTQIVIRLFENMSKELGDPKRFRIEIFFSPGATATPLHMSELEKDKDTSRFDTEPLKLISRPDLTCQELEEYFKEAIEEGRVEDDDDHHDVEVKKAGNEIVNKSASPPKNIEVIPVPSPEPPKQIEVVPSPSPVPLGNMEIVPAVNSDQEQGVNEKSPTERIKFVTISEEKNTHIPFTEDSAHSTLAEDPLTEYEVEIDDKVENEAKNENSPTEDTLATNNSYEQKMKDPTNPTSNKAFDANSEEKDQVEDTVATSEEEEISDEADIDNDDDDVAKLKEMTVVLARQYFWTSVAAVSFVLGIGCLILSREIVETDFKTRRWTRR